MQTIDFDEVLDQILSKDSRYRREAYLFVREALDHTQKAVCKKEKGKVRHVTGRELLEGIREYALEAYGPMAFQLLEEWGVGRCEDFGEIVFNMIDFGLLNKRDSDSREDFRSVYTFAEAFQHPFLPPSRLAGRAAEIKPAGC